jgi:hypothetical protein
MNHLKTAADRGRKHVVEVIHIKPQILLRTEVYKKCLTCHKIIRADVTKLLLLHQKLTNVKFELIVQQIL